MNEDSLPGSTLPPQLYHRLDYEIAATDIIGGGPDVTPVVFLEAPSAWGRSGTAGEDDMARELVFVEDAATGRFRRITLDKHRGDRPDGSSADARQAQHELLASKVRVDAATCAPVSALYSAIVTVERMLSLLFVFCQGLLAGVGLLQLVIIYTAESVNAFLTGYSNSAIGVAYLVIVLIIISVYASADRISRNALDRFQTSPDARHRHLATAFLYFVSIAMSLSSVPFDQFIFYAQQQFPAWYEEQTPTNSSSSAFSQQLTVWKALTTTRIVCDLVAWLLVCYEFRPPADVQSNRQLFLGRSATEQVTVLSTNPSA